MVVHAFALLCSLFQDAYRYDATFQSTVSYKIGNIFCLGTFDKDGEFIPVVSSIPRENEWDITGSGPMPLESSLRENAKYFELRHGVLIPVIYYKDRGFVPEIGGKIIPFSEYKYTPLSRRIYNLPGRFIPKGQPDLYPSRNPK